MTGDIHNPHDKLFKQVLGDKENAASFLSGNLPESIVRHLDFESIEVLQTSFIDAQYAQSEADLLISLEIAGRPGFVYILFEHQSGPDPMMLLRLLSYKVRAWERYTVNNPEARCLPAILSLVFLHGPKEWQGPLDFHSLVELPSEDFARYTPDFHIILFDLTGPAGEAVAGNAVVRMMADILGALGRQDFMERIEKAFNILNELVEAPNFARYFEILFRYILDVYDVHEKTLMDMAVRSIKKDVREAAVTTSERIREEGRVEGEREGKREGEREAASAILARQLAKRFQIDPMLFLPMLRALSFDQHEELSDKILEADSLDDIRRWLETASHN